MDTILDFLVDNYIWVLIISVFLILVLIGYIADQKRKLKKIKQQNVQVSDNNINNPVQEAVQNVNVVPNPVVSEPIVNEPVNIEVNTIETPTFEPINSDISIPTVETPVNEVVEPTIETPIEEITQPIESIEVPVEKSPAIEPVIEQAENSLASEPIIEEVPQTILDIPDNVTDIEIPVQENIVQDENPVIEETPIVEDTEIIEEPEIIDETTNTQNIVNTWEPELIQENKDIINQEESKDSI